MITTDFYKFIFCNDFIFYKPANNWLLCYLYKKRYVVLVSRSLTSKQMSLPSNICFGQGTAAFGCYGKCLGMTNNNGSINWTNCRICFEENQVWPIRQKSNLFFLFISYLFISITCRHLYFYVTFSWNLYFNIHNC